MSKYYSDDRGILIPLEFSKLPFEPKRIFVADVNAKNTERGGHAHHTTEQFAICIEGKIDMVLYANHNKPAETIIMKKGDAIYIPKMVWDKQIYKTEDSKLLVLCSTEYNRDDYITSMSEFNNLLETKKQIEKD